MMRWMPVLLAIGCGSKSEPKQQEAPPAPRPSVTDPIGFCERAQMLILGRKKCFPEDSSLGMALDEVATLIGGAPADAEGRRRVAVKCALMIDGMSRAKQPADCPLNATDEERAELTAFLGAWYGERTAPPTTGNAEVDAMLVKVAAERDAACACKDLGCARKAVTDLALPVGAGAAAEDAKAKMLDEVERCKQKITRGF